MSESYTHFLISASKNYRPTPQAVCQFLEQIIQAQMVGSDHRIEFARITKVEPRYREVRNPFTGETVKRKAPPRMRSKREVVPSTSNAAQLAEQEREYDVAVVSTSAPTKSPLDIGCIKNGIWQAWTEPYHLEIRCCVREALVRLSFFKPGENPNAPLTDEFIANYTPKFDEDCGEGDQDGLFVHPEAPNGIHVPNAGCGMFWIEFEYGKWLYPRLKGDDLALLAPAVTDLARKTFGTDFIEACSWG